MIIPIEYSAYEGFPEEERVKQYTIDLLEIVKEEGDCFNIPCYENDCPIFNWCHNRGEISLRFSDREKYCRNKLKEIPQDILFEIVL